MLHTINNSTFIVSFSNGFQEGTPEKLFTSGFQQFQMRGIDMIKTIWLSYDLGVKGDYQSFYAWLDNHKAIECGDSLAVIKYEVPEGATLPDKLKQDLDASITFSKTDRVYVIWKNDNDGNTKGRFIIGKRKASPWEGYGDSVSEDDL